MSEYVVRPKVSVVIPVFNGQKYLNQTLDSMLNQAYTSFEVVCINDCSTDASLSILKEYEEKDSRIRIFSTTSNLGIVPKVMNFALPHIRGEYFFYSSQDDLFSNDLLENLITRAIEIDADAVIPDLAFYHETAVHKNKTLIGLCGDRSIILSGRQAVELSLDWTIPGNALLRFSLVKSIGFYEFGMNADEYSARIFFFNCNKIAFSKGIFYYRKDNPNAITKMLSINTFDMPYTDFMLWNFLREHNFLVEWQEKILRRAIYGLMKMKVALIVHNSTNSSSEYALHGADDRIKKCFHSFKDVRVEEFIKNRGGLKNRIAAFAVRGDFKAFSAMCYLFTPLKFLKSIIKIKNNTQLL